MTVVDGGGGGGGGDDAGSFLTHTIKCSCTKMVVAVSTMLNLYNREWQCENLTLENTRDGWVGERTIIFRKIIAIFVSQI